MRGPFDGWMNGWMHPNQYYSSVLLSILLLRVQGANKIQCCLSSYRGRYVSHPLPCVTHRWRPCACCYSYLAEKFDPKNHTGAVGVSQDNALKALKSSDGSKPQEDFQEIPIPTVRLSEGLGDKVARAKLHQAVHETFPFVKVRVTVRISVRVEGASSVPQVCLNSPAFMGRVEGLGGGMAPELPYTKLHVYTCTHVHYQ